MAQTMQPPAGQPAAPPAAPAGFQLPGIWGRLAGQQPPPAQQQGGPNNQALGIAMNMLGQGMNPRFSPVSWMPMGRMG
jgi:hypothetical protein